ncbi:hypothetical protein P355_3986 [Burkholderia cenocepacia KC-01]|nr:hypothetical protein P355_3986 [Burkholderia cenocepacia KC-01]
MRDGGRHGGLLVGRRCPAPERGGQQCDAMHCRAGRLVPIVAR